MIEIAELLNLDAATIEAMRRTRARERGKLFGPLIRLEHGGLLDWRDDIDQVYELLEICLSAEQWALLPEREVIAAPTLGRKVRELSRYLEPSGDALRLIESLGDSYYLIVVPVALVSKFDAIAKTRAVEAD